MPETASKGTRILLPAASDPDAGENGTIARYELVEKSDNFRVGWTDDSVYLELISPIDREVKESYRLELLAFDGGAPQRYLLLFFRY